MIASQQSKLRQQNACAWNSAQAEARHTTATTLALHTVAGALEVAITRHVHTHAITHTSPSTCPGAAALSATERHACKREQTELACTASLTAATGTTGSNALSTTLAAIDTFAGYDAHQYYASMRWHDALCRMGTCHCQPGCCLLMPCCGAYTLSLHVHYSDCRYYLYHLLPCSTCCMLHPTREQQYTLSLYTTRGCTCCGMQLDKHHPQATTITSITRIVYRQKPRWLPSLPLDHLTTGTTTSQAKPMCWPQHHTPPSAPHTLHSILAPASTCALLALPAPLPGPAAAAAAALPAPPAPLSTRARLVVKLSITAILLLPTLALAMARC